MFSWLSKILDREDNQFVENAFDANKRQLLIKQLKRGRLSSLILVILNGGVILFGTILGIGSPSTINIPGPTLFLFFLSFILLIMADIQIKILILHQKTLGE